MVRLKEGKTGGFTYLLSIFQFHYGSVKRSCGNINSTKPGKFQFHYGSVKRFFRLLLLLPRLAFQFHYGSVKRGHGKVQRRHGTGHFNSTMVRLKDWEGGFVNDKDDNFNSTMVRLKVVYPLPSPAAVVISIPLWFG